MNIILDSIRSSRRDLSDWLWHFTRRDGVPFDTLKAIRDSKCIKASVDKYCSIECVCLTEMPITEAIRQAQALNATTYKRFSEYGIGFKRDWVAEKGGLPVIYQPDSMLSHLSAEAKWRHCTFDLKNGIDFAWQREWRVRCKSLDFDSNDNVLFVVRTLEEGYDLVNPNLYTCDKLEETFYDADYSFVTHDALANAIHPSELDVHSINPD